MQLQVVLHSSIQQSQPVCRMQLYRVMHGRLPKRGYLSSDWHAAVLGTYRQKSGRLRLRKSQSLQADIDTDGTYAGWRQITRRV